MVECRALVFDLDDTLYPERDYVLGAFQHVAGWAASQFGIPAKEGYSRLLALFESGVRRDTFDRWLSAYGLMSRDRIAQLVEIYRGHHCVLRPFPGVPELLGSLRQRFRLGLVSDGHLATQRRKWAALELNHFFDAIVFSDEWGRAAWKPSPIPFRAVLSRLNIRAAEAVYLADNPEKDFLGARRAHMRSVWLRLPGGEYAHRSPRTAEHASDYSVSSFAELAGLLGALPADARQEAGDPQ